MNDRLQRIENELVEELERVDGDLAEVEQRRGSLLADRARVAASLAELRGKPNTAKPSGMPAAKRGKSRQPCATKAEVAALVSRVIAQNGPCTEKDLIDLVEDLLKEAGKSLSGFKLRYEGVRREMLNPTADGRLTLAGSAS